MAIVTLQRRARELGRIRIGQVVKASNGRTRPAKLDRFRLTSPSRPLLDRVAALYGGTVAEWTPANGAPGQWEVVTDATRLPVLVPPQPVSQYFELWSGGGCQRRCDGVRELLSDQPCLCSPEPEDRDCKPTTRLNVILRDIEGIGVWRLESHGYYSATELPEVAEFLARTNGYVAAHLALEQRTVKRDGKTHNFAVPALEVDITPMQLLAGTTGTGTGAAQMGAAQPVAALPAAPTSPSVTWDEDSIVASVHAATTVDELSALWKGLAEQGAPDMPAVKAAFAQRGAELKNPAGAGEPLPEADTLWQQILSIAPQDWSTQDVENHFTSVTGVDVSTATSTDMARYLDIQREAQA